MGIHLATRARPTAPRSPSFSIDPAALGHGRWARRLLVVAALALVGVGLLFSAAHPRTEAAPAASDAPHETRPNFGPLPPTPPGQ